MLEKAEKDAEALKKEKVFEARDEVHKLRSDAEKEIRDQRQDIQRIERRLEQGRIP